MTRWFDLWRKANFDAGFIMVGGQITFSDLWTCQIRCTCI